MPNEVINEKPKINIIALSRYITSNSSKQIKILQTLKFSEAANFARYSSPRSAINRYLKDADRKIVVFDEFLKIEDEKKPENFYKASDKKCSIETLTILKSKSQSFFAPYINHFSKMRLNKQFTHIYSEGVDVSLSPDFIIYNNQSKKLEGFVKVNFAKDKKKRLTYAQGHLITGLLKDHLEEQFEVKLDRRMCLAIDVYAEKAIIAPEDMTWIKDKPKLNKAFKDIASVWPFIQKRVA